MHNSNNNKTITNRYNGNMTADKNRKMTISYNNRNLPATVTVNGSKIEYVYDADGTLMRRKVTVTNGGPVTTYHYMGDIVYSQTSSGLALSYITTSRGRIMPASGEHSYEYNITDHLGNLRASFNNLTCLQENSYNPYGTQSVSNVYSGQTKNNYLFNGKEQQTEIAGFGFYNYGARFYDPALGRWHSPDPLAEKYYSWSPYNYCVGNPLRFVDLDGRKIVDAAGNTIYTNSGGWSKNAPSDAVRLGNSMMKTRTGYSQFQKMVDSEYGITLNISQKSNIHKIDGKTVYKLGEASKSVSYDPNTGDYTINSVNITVFEGTLNEYLDKANTSKADAYRISTENNDQAIGAIGAHESFHATDPQNIKESHENKLKGTSHDVEKGPNKVEIKVLDEQHILNMRPLEPITPQL